MAGQCTVPARKLDAVSESGDTGNNRPATIAKALNGSRNETFVQDLP